jgi:transposase
VTTGQAVKAMVLNGLGFVSASLYLYSSFFKGKVTEHLLGNNITAEMLNDDLLGRVLDRLFNFGVSRL